MCNQARLELPSCASGHGLIYGWPLGWSVHTPYLLCEHFVESDQDEGLDKTSKSNVSVEINSSC